MNDISSETCNSDNDVFVSFPEDDMIELDSVSHCSEFEDEYVEYIIEPLIFDVDFVEVEKVGMMDADTGLAVTNQPVETLYLPIVKMTDTNFVSCSLADGLRILALVDTGSSRSFVSRSVIESSRFLRSIPIIEGDVCDITIGDGSSMRINRFMYIPLQLDACSIMICAFVLECNSPVQMVLGVDSQERYKAILDCYNHTMTVTVPNVDLILAEDVCIPPGQSVEVVLAALDYKPFLYGPFEIELNVQIRSLAYKHLIAEFRHGQTKIKLLNSSEVVFTWKREEVVGHIVLTTCIQHHLPCVSIEQDVTEKLQLLFSLKRRVEKNEFQYQKEQYMVIVDEGEEISDGEVIKEYDEDQMTENQLKDYRLSKYPWLDSDDFRLTMSKKDIIRKMVDLSDTKFSSDQVQQLLASLERNSACLSLFGEIGCLKRWAVDIAPDLIDPNISFSATPYITSADDIAFTRSELKKLIQLGIFEPRLATVTSSLFLVRRTPTSKPRIVCDLRRLNSVTKQVHRPGTTIRSFCRTFGHQIYRFLSCLDIRSAYHSVRVVGKSLDLLGVVSYPGATALGYCRLPMGHRSSSTNFSQIIDFVLNDLSSDQRMSVIDYLDDLLVFNVTPEEHLSLLDRIFELFQEVGLVLSLDKCQFAPKTGVDFLGYEIRFSDLGDRPQLCIKQSRVDALLALKRPRSRTEIKRFLGSCQYVSMFLHNYQMVIYPLTKLLKKSIEFHWGSEQEDAWQSIKRILTSAPLLVFPNDQGRFVLVTDGSREACGSVLFQMQMDETTGKEIPRLVGYASRVLSHINCQSYSVTELEMTALLYGCASFKHFLGQRHFYALTDHKALQFIFANSAEFATARIRRLYWKLLEYQFTVLYVKGDTPLLAMADLLSRHPSDLWQREDYYVVPISLQEKEMAENDSMDQPLDVWFVDESFKGTVMKDDLQCFSISHYKFFENFKGRRIFDSKGTADHFMPVVTRSQTRMVESELEENPESYQTNETIETPSTTPRTVAKGLDDLSSAVRVPLSVGDQDKVTVSTDVQSMSSEELSAGNPVPIVLTRAPHQHDLEPSIRKYFADIICHVKIPRTKEEILGTQKNDVFLGPIIAFIKNGKLTGDRKNAASVMKLSEQFALVDGLLYRVTSSNNHDKVRLQLALPEAMVFEVLDFYHTTFLGVHLRMFKLYSLVKGYFYIKNLFNHVMVYVKSCLQCQRLNEDSKANFERPYQPRLLTDAKPFSTIHMDFMIFPLSMTNIRFCLLIQCEMTRFVIGVPMRNKDAQSVCKALMDHLIMPYFIPDRIIADLEPSFRSELVQALHKSLGVQMHFVKPMGHGSLVVERALQTIRNYLKSMVEYKFSQWPVLIQSAIKAYNITPLVHLKYSPSYLVFLREESSFMTCNMQPLSVVAASYDEYVTLLQERLVSVREEARKLHNAVKMKQSEDHIARVVKIRDYLEGDLVLLRAPRLSGLQSSQKLVIHYVGPLVVLRRVDQNSVLLSTIDNQELSGQFHVARLKHVVLRGRHGEKLTTIGELREAL